MSYAGLRAQMAVELGFVICSFSEHVFGDVSRIRAMVDA